MSAVALPHEDNSADLEVTVGERLRIARQRPKTQDESFTLKEFAEAVTELTGEHCAHSTVSKWERKKVLGSHRGFLEVIEIYARLTGYSVASLLGYESTIHARSMLAALPGQPGEQTELALEFADAPFTRPEAFATAS